MKLAEKLAKNKFYAIAAVIVTGTITFASFTDAVDSIDQRFGISDTDTFKAVAGSQIIQYFRSEEEKPPSSVGTSELTSPSVGTSELSRSSSPKKISLCDNQSSAANAGFAKRDRAEELGVIVPRIVSEVIVDDLRC